MGGFRAGERHDTILRVEAGDYDSCARERCCGAALGEQRGDCGDGRYGALQNVFHLSKPNLDIEISSANLSIWRSVSQSRHNILPVVSELSLGGMPHEWTF